MDNARKKSRANDENEVKLPQKPVARPMYSGIAFLRFIRSAFCIAPKSVVMFDRPLDLFSEVGVGDTQPSRNKP